MWDADELSMVQVNERLRAQLKDTEARLAQKEEDLDALEGSLRETRKLSESRTTDQYAMQLELDRVKRDLQRCESDLERVRKELDKREDVLRERENVIAGLVGPVPLPEGERQYSDMNAARE
jgi:chromosome segregation ATPase